MLHNVGTVDRIIRLIAGLAIIAWGIFAQNWLGAIGIIPVFTALVSWCGVYMLFGINSCTKEDLKAK